MRIGILTFQRAYNYGTIFQMYALEHVLENIGSNEVKIIDYECTYINNVYKPMHIDKRNKSILKAIVKAVLLYDVKKRRYAGFDNFVSKHIKLTGKVNNKNLKELNQVFDAFIVGSDQIWNDELTNFDEAFYLNFVNDGSKKYAYSASFGYTKIPADHYQIVSKHLKDFQKISVREESAVRIIQDCTGNVTPQITLDPTLLLDSQVWNELAISINSKDKYILLYTVQPPVDLIKFALLLKKTTGLEIIYLNDQIKRIKGITYKSAVTPEEFLGYFRNAEYVLSNSFHGTVFSIIFKKKFFVETRCKTQINIRAKELLELLGLQNRDKLDINIYNENIDWNMVEQKLEIKKKESLNYLQRIAIQE